MGRRQKRVNVLELPVLWKEYLNKELSLVCTNGTVFRGTLKRADKDKLVLTDLLGRDLKLFTAEVKELIIDFTSHH